MKLLANNSYGYQFLDRSRHSVVEKTRRLRRRMQRSTTNFSRLFHINDERHEVELL